MTNCKYCYQLRLSFNSEMRICEAGNGFFYLNYIGRWTWHLTVLTNCYVKMGIK